MLANWLDTQDNEINVLFFISVTVSKSNSSPRSTSTCIMSYKELDYNGFLGLMSEALSLKFNNVE